MSMITEQVERMRRLADEMEKSTFVHEATHFIAIKVLREAANTIEQLAAKVRKENGFIFPENPTNGDIKDELISRNSLAEFANNSTVGIDANDIMRFSIIPAIPIPDNATNGDILLSMFDTATVYGIDKENDWIVICLDNYFYQKFRYSWWNSPYKRGDTE